MGKELFSVSTDKVAEGALATSAAVATAMYVKSQIDKKKRKEATQLLEIFDRTLGTVDFPRPFNLDNEDGEVRIPKELQQYTLEQIAHGNPYERVLSKVGSHLSSYNNNRKKTGDPIHSVLCYLHYIMLSPSGLIGLTGRNKKDFEKLEMFASFLKQFAQMPGAKSRVSFIARILEIMPTQQQDGSQQALDQKEQDQDKGFRKSINAYTALQGIADSVNAEVDFSRLERLSRRFADSTLRLATMGASSPSIHAPLTTALLDDIAVGTVVPAVEKKGIFSIDESATVLPTDDPFGLIKVIQQVAASLEDFNYQSDTLFQLTPDQLKELITTSPFKSSEFNVKNYSKTGTGKTQTTDLSEAEKLGVARGYVAMLQLAQISADIARLAHYMNVHIRTESASSAAPFAFSTSDTTTAVRKRCYETMALLKKKADEIYQQDAQPLISHLDSAGQVDGLMRPQATYSLAEKLHKFKEALNDAYKDVKKYEDPDHFNVARDQSSASIHKLEQEVAAVAQKYGIGEEQLTKQPFVPRTDYKDINAALAAHVQNLLKHFSRKEFAPLAQSIFGNLVSYKDKQFTFDIQYDADLIKLEALAEKFIQQLESGHVKPKKTRATHPGAMLGSVSGPDLAFGYIPQTSEDPKDRAQRIRDHFREHTKGFRESTQRYAEQAKQREDGKIARADTLEEMARLRTLALTQHVAATAAKNGFREIGKELDEANSTIDQLKKSGETMKVDLTTAQDKLATSETLLGQAQDAMQKKDVQIRHSFEYLEGLVIEHSKQLEENNQILMEDLRAMANSVPDKEEFKRIRNRQTARHQQQVDFLEKLLVEFRAAAKICLKDSEQVTQLIGNAKEQLVCARAVLSSAERELEKLRKVFESLSAQYEALKADSEAKAEAQADRITELEDKLASETQPKSEELQRKEVNTALSPSDNTRRTGNLFEIVVKALEKSEKNLAGTNKGKILELLRDDLQTLKEDFMSDSDFKMMLKQVLGVACQHRGSDGGFAKNATTTGNFVINLIEADSLIRAVIDPSNTKKKLDFERDILRGFLGVNDKKLRQDRTTEANLHNETKGNIFHAAFITDAGSVSRPPVEALPVVAAAAG
ncbi:ATPase involved in DNA repair [Piscirickettsia salmonis]|uniref:ATPase involved in DNA repair n=1 Tax=Piscirickettsia salmonis TaxID=1238 RepID=A0A9Q6LLY2_PISSA|nr:hypothetical protein [Piscirickettsia salmonis]QGN94676.1 ATPase involved in DNA repair [Piscirickettsia salmonis]QGO06374.1 ATPase involved in DNA repair [Piscirickettsia salmonis]QGO34700.1 ATPase involved in DNA repair [Piscirickettsia salmonis]QGO38316.1 ATPase involved in DNA repair [Piscirickettsia salmonis]QGO41933.1 ATPase involved in DNA repair [Piscirickettsia salmonis]